MLTRTNTHRIAVSVDTQPPMPPPTHWLWISFHIRINFHLPHLFSVVFPETGFLRLPRQTLATVSSAFTPCAEVRGKHHHAWLLFFLTAKLTFTIEIQHQVLDGVFVLEATLVYFSPRKCSRSFVCLDVLEENLPDPLKFEILNNCPSRVSAFRKGKRVPS